MSEMGHAACVAVIATIAAVLSLAVSGCGAKGGSAGSAIATSTASAKAKEQLNTCMNKVGATGLLSSSGRSQFSDCMKSLVPPAKQAQFKNCIISAAEGDQLWTSSGRSKFTDQSLPNCMNAAA